MPKETPRLAKRIEHDIFGTTPRKKSINSKKKGNANEREVGKFLKLWTGLEFNRVPQSGGLRWKSAEGITGDLVCEDKSFPFCVETKHYKKLTFSKVLRSNSSIYTIWQQAKRDAYRAGKKPMLILRHNGMPKGEFMLYFDIRLPDTIVPASIGREPELWGYYSTDFLDKVIYDKLCELLK